MKPPFAAVLAALTLSALTAQAQNASTPPPASSGDQDGLSEIMTLQQLRHIKLWFAGSAGNWALADYELGELGDGFADVDQLLGGSIVENMVGAPLKELQKVVDEKNRAAFPAAFDSLSAGCNACHHTLDHAFIVIKRPELLPYSDQSFEPQK